MRRMRHLSSALPFVFASLLAAVGCGGSTPPAGEPHEHGHEHEGGHDKLGGPLKEFHDVLAPLWHADKGPEREKKTCAATASFEERAAAAKDEGIIAAVGALKVECAKAEGGRADFEAKFAAVHEAFHHAAEKAHGEH
jgi:hypothetical protein